MSTTFKKSALCSAAAAALFVAPAAAQEDADIIIVTGVPQETTKLESTSSVTALGEDEIRNRAPRSTAELFRGLPGVQAEASSGDANTNLKVRGLPISSGGSRYVSFQEDGFPTLLVGDTAFATADSFLRVDSTIDNLQLIRGGTSTTLAPNAPGGIFNLISKTGEEEGGSIAVTAGLDYESYRADFEYGRPISDEWSYHVGGFYRTGEGPRDTNGANVEEGGQVKATLAGEFDRGSLRFHFKHLDDTVPTYLPIPAVYNGGTSFSEAGVDFGDGTLFLDTTDFANRRDGVDAVDGDGFQAKMTSFAIAGDFELTDDLTAGFKHRSADIQGSFASPFPATVFNDVTAGPSVEIVYFNTELRDLGNSFTDFNLTGEFENFTLKGGLQLNTQTISTDWNFNQYYRRLDGNLTVFDQNGSVNGVLFGNPAFGNCCTRAYEFKVDNYAPYIVATGEIGNLNWDASFRSDSYDVTGFFAESAVQAPQDINGDGTIGPNEQAVNSVGASERANYEADFDSWSVGANYAINDDLAIFANISEGNSLTSPDRITGSLNTNGTIDNQAAFSVVEQFELGLKYVGDNGSFFVTYFDADTTESRQFEVTTQSFIQNDFESSGVELEGNYDFGNGLKLSGSATFTDAEITGTASGANVGNTPRRQADFIYNITPSYEAENWNVGLNIFGTDEVPVQDSNQLFFPAYEVVTLFANYQVNDKVTISLNSNNLFDEDQGFTEGEEGAANPGDFVRIRPINGRTTSVTLRYNFN